MLTRRDCLALDRSDPLGSTRERFALPEDLIYLDGNSLGAQVAHGVEAGGTILTEWRDRLIGGWFDRGWWELPLELGDRIGRIVGAAPGQVVVCDTTTTNLYKTLRSALGLVPDRAVVLVEESSFPTDRYVVEEVAAQMDRQVRIVPRGGSIAEHVDESVGAAVINHLDFRTAELLDLASITSAVHAAGVLVLWDLSHTAGVIPMSLDEAGVDFAVGCTYKFLNGGPGSPAYLYVAERHQDAIAQPIPGWLGHAAPFDMTDTYEPAPGVRRFLTGTQPIISMRSVDAALDVYDEVEIDRIREKSISLTDLFVRLIDERCDGSDLRLISPREAERRGSQVSLTHPEALMIHERLVAAGVRGDFRTPDILRFGFAPLYVSHSDVWDAVDALRSVVS